MEYYRLYTKWYFPSGLTLIHLSRHVVLKIYYWEEIPFFSCDFNFLASLSTSEYFSSAIEVRFSKLEFISYVLPSFQFSMSLKRIFIILHCSWLVFIIFPSHISSADVINIWLLLLDYFKRCHIQTDLEPICIVPLVFSSLEMMSH